MASTTLGLILKSAGLISLAFLLQFIYTGFSTRRRFLKMHRAGLPVPQPYSILFGHLALLKKSMGIFPKNAKPLYVQQDMVRNWQKYFPDAEACPPIIYLDLWPIAPLVAIAVDPSINAQVTQEKSQPRAPAVRAFLAPLTSGKDLVSADAQTHRIWRARLNPGFAVKNLMTHMPALLEECSTFVDVLRKSAGSGQKPGEIIFLVEHAINLTLDVISRVSLDLRLGEQLNGPTDLRVSMRNLSSHMRADSVYERIRRSLPWVKRDIMKNRKSMHDLLLPQIHSKLGKAHDQSKGKTVLDLALREVEVEAGNGGIPTPSKEFLNEVLDQLVVFQFGGHDTTSLTVSWALCLFNPTYELYKNPDTLAKLRAELDQVLGPDAKDAVKVLSESPYKLNELSYALGVIKESLRVHPLGATFRECSPNFDLVLDGVHYPTDGFGIQSGGTVTHVSPHLWPRSLEFLPERFTVPQGDPLHPLKNAWRGFGAGPLNCIGQELAMMEMKVILALTVREFDFEFPWAEWDRQRGVDDSSQLLEGDRAFWVAGSGGGSITGNLPTRVWLRA